jgi:putative sigma-54 modulation protein
MQINFTGRNIEVTSALKTFTAEKMERIQRRFTNVSEVNIIFHVEHLSQIAEATAIMSGVEIHATATTEDMYNSIDELVDKLLTLMTKHKEKITDHR